MTLRLFLLNPDVMMDALVNEPAEVDYPIAEVDFDTISAGAYTNVFEGQTVMFGLSTHADDRRGRQRIRADADATTIYISRSSQGSRDGEVVIANDYYIRCLWDYRVWFTAGRIDEDGTIYKDHNIAFAENTRPVSNCGVGTAATIDSGSGVLRVQHPDTAQTSFATMPGASISSYSWGLPSGANLVAGYNLTDAAIQVDYDPGFYWISLEVTDSNGQTHKSRCPVLAHDPDNSLLIENFEILEHTITTDGQRLRIKINDEIDETDYPDGSLVMLWDDANEGGVTSRTHMIFIGWHHVDPATIESTRTGYTRETILECVDVAGRLAMLPGFPQSIIHADSPSKWYEMDSPNMDRFIHYLLDRHTTALQLADFTWSGETTTYPFSILGADGENYWDQCKSKYAAMGTGWVFGCDRFGRLQVKVDPLYQDSGDRTATVQDTIAADDYEFINYTHQRPPRVHWARGGGIVGSNSSITAVFSIAPGGTPGQGEIANDDYERLVTNQAQINKVTGHRYARLNAPETFFTIRLARDDTVGIEPADMTWVRLTLAAPYATQRNLELSTENGLVHEVRINYQTDPALAKTVELLWERATTGFPGLTEILPDLPPPPPIEPPPPDPGGNDPPGYGDGLGTAYIMDSGGLERTSALGDASPSWTDVSGSLTGTLYDFILDPFDPSAAWAMTSTGIWRCDDIKTGSTWSQQLTAAAILTGTGGQTSISSWGSIHASINVEDYVCFFVRTDSAGAYKYHCVYSTNGGAGWSYGQVGNSYAPSGNVGGAFAGGSDILGHTVGGGIVLMTNWKTYSGATGHRQRVYRSTDGGANWSEVSQWTASSGGLLGLTLPYEDNEDGQSVFAFRSDGSTRYVLESTDGGANWSTLESTSLGGLSFRKVIETNTLNADIIYYWYNNRQLRISTNGGSTFADVGSAPAGVVTWAGGGFPNNTNLFYALTSSGGVYVSLDRGDTWLDKTGDSALSFAAARMVIVPDWTEA